MWKKGSPQSLQRVTPVIDEVASSWIPGEPPFHSRRIAFRKWSPNLASVRKHEPHAEQVKGRREEGSVGKGERQGRGVEGRLEAWGRGVDKANSKRLEEEALGRLGGGCS